MNCLFLGAFCINHYRRRCHTTDESQLSEVHVGSKLEWQIGDGLVEAELRKLKLLRVVRLEESERSLQSSGSQT